MSINWGALGPAHVGKTVIWQFPWLDTPSSGVLTRIGYLSDPDADEWVHFIDDSPVQLPNTKLVEIV